MTVGAVWGPRPAPGAVVARDWTGWTKTSDPNNLVQAFSVAPNGALQVQMQNPALARGEPGSVGGAATFSRPGFRDTLGTPIASLALAEYVGRLRIHERIIPVTSPNLMRLTYGFADNADPSLAVNAVAITLTYDSGALRHVGITKCTALNTWANTSSGAGDTTTFGVDGNWRIVSKTQLNNFTACPLDIFDQVPSAGVIGTNTSTSAGLSVVSALTHEFISMGWIGVGTTGDTLGFNVGYLLQPVGGA